VIEIGDQNVDFRNCESIKSAVSSCVASAQKQVLLNLGQVTFMDSAGLGVILFCKRTCEEAGGKFAVSNVQQYVNNLMTLTHLHKALAIFNTEADALTAVA
jgi:anti-sigma B factor antagonist